MAHLNLITFLKVLPPGTVPLGIRDWTCDVGGDTVQIQDLFTCRGSGNKKKENFEGIFEMT